MPGDWLDYLPAASFLAAGLGALYKGIKGQIEKNHAEVKTQIEEKDKASEARTVRTHTRIDELRTSTDEKFTSLSNEIKDNYVHKELHKEVVKRIDGELDYLRRFAVCPVDQQK